MNVADDPLGGDPRRVPATPGMRLILEVCSRAIGMRFVGVARAGDERWHASTSPGDPDLRLDPAEALEIGAALRGNSGRRRGLVVIGDLSAGGIRRGHAAPPRHGVGSYVSTPITRPDGTHFGTLCALDPAPRRLDPDAVAVLKLFARLVALELRAQDGLREGRSALASERDTARLREEFIAVVGHDLRNPVAAVSAGLRMLGRRPPEEEAAALVVEMQRSALRMGQIIDNLLDFARGRLGGGIGLEAARPVDLEPVLRGVAREIERLSDRTVVLALDLSRPIQCDPQRIGQLLSNLLGNAVTHGPPCEPIEVQASDVNGRFRLAVTNRGAPIPEEVRPSLFLPFSRGGGGGEGSLQGLGLGLYIASQIARAHGGRLDVESGGTSTTFALTMPAPRKAARRVGHALAGASSSQPRPRARRTD